MHAWKNINPICVVIVCKSQNPKRDLKNIAMIWNHHTIPYQQYESLNIFGCQQQQLPPEQLRLSPATITRPPGGWTRLHASAALRPFERYQGPWWRIGWTLVMELPEDMEMSGSQFLEWETLGSGMSLRLEYSAETCRDWNTFRIRSTVLKTAYWSVGILFPNS